MRLIYPTEERALTWAKRAATWQRRTMFVLRLSSRQFEIVKERPMGEYWQVTPLQEVTTWKSGMTPKNQNGGLNHE